MENRRKFIKNTAKVVAGCCCLGTTQLLTGCSSTIYVAGIESGNTLKVDKKEFLDQKFIVVNSVKLASPVYLKIDGESYKALSMHCTHKGCTVKPAGSIMVCPCHGAEFSSDGEVLSGPANKKLIEYPVTVKDNLIEIKIG